MIDDLLSLRLNRDVAFQFIKQELIQQLSLFLLRIAGGEGWLVVLLAEGECTREISESRIWHCILETTSPCLQLIQIMERRKKPH
jgi:hypothetical protein